MPPRRTSATVKETDTANVVAADSRPKKTRARTKKVSPSPAPTKTAKKIVVKKSAGTKRTYRKKVVPATPEQVPVVRASQSPVPSLVVPPLTATGRRTMTSMECFLYGGVVCLVGTIGLGLLLGLVVLPPIVATYEQSQYSYAAPLPSQDSLAPSADTLNQASDVTEKAEFGFYGTLLSREGTVLMVKELFPPLPLETKQAQPPMSKTFVVRVTDSTEYTYQRPREKENVSDPVFSPESGSIDAIKPGMFVFVNTTDNPEQTETLNAQHILYSELSPFTE